MKKAVLILVLLMNIKFQMFLCQGNILFFVSHEDTYYSEYIVALRAFQDAGYTVDVRSASNLPASTYMIPANTNIEETANTLPGSNFNNFQAQYASFFGAVWDASYNAIPGLINTNGSIHDVVNMNQYEAFVISGGTGINQYRIDGSYESQGVNERHLTAQHVQQTAEKLNELALNALAQGKPILAQCHGASLPVFWRIPNTTGPGAESLGLSVLRDQDAAGFPQFDTTWEYSQLFVNHNQEARVQVSNPNSQFAHFNNAKGRIITSRDWYPQTVAHACKSLLNVLETYPSLLTISQQVQVLVLHGGAVDPNNCHHTNRLNDIPCNYGVGDNLPADFTDIVQLLTTNSFDDGFQFAISDLNITGQTLPYNPASTNEIMSYFEQFDVIIFYKHWSTGVTIPLQNALVSFVDNGGGLIGLHHGLYNDIDGALNKNIIINQLFGASSEMNTWSPNMTTLSMYNTNYGHFINTYDIPYSAPNAPNNWSSSDLPAGSNASFSFYHQFPIYDELYNNMSFIANQEFGSGVNEIQLLFANNQWPSNQIHTTGYVKRVNINMDEHEGKLAYFIVGERQESFAPSHPFAQVLRNAVFWSANVSEETVSLPVEMQSIGVNCHDGFTQLHWATSSEFNASHFVVERSRDGILWLVQDTLQAVGTTTLSSNYHFDEEAHGGLIYYRLIQVDTDGNQQIFGPVSSACEVEKSEITVYPNPAKNTFFVEIHAVTNADNTQLQVLDNVGRVIQEQSVDLMKGSNTFFFDISKLNSGTYFIHAKNREQSMESVRFVVL